MIDVKILNLITEFFLSADSVTGANIILNILIESSFAS